MKIPKLNEENAPYRHYRSEHSWWGLGGLFARHWLRVRLALMRAKDKLEHL